MNGLDGLLGIISGCRELNRATGPVKNDLGELADSYVQQRQGMLLSLGLSTVSENLNPAHHEVQQAFDHVCQVLALIEWIETEATRARKATTADDVLKRLYDLQSGANRLPTLPDEAVRALKRAESVFQHHIEGFDATLIWQTVDAISRTNNEAISAAPDIVKDAIAATHALQR